MLFKDWINFRFPDDRTAKSDRMGINSLITVYIVLHVLRQMREELGLEAALEYAVKYMEKIERHNPKIKAYTAKFMPGLDVEQMYKDSKS